MPSDSTVDPSLIGRMIHTNDNDPGSERRADQQSGKLVSPSAQIAGLSSPEFLHCGVWPPPPEDDNERPPGLPFDRETQIVAATAPPAILSAANKACEKSVSTPDDSEWSGMSSEAVCGSASTSDEDASRTEQAGPSVPSWEELSSAMDTWIIKSSKSREHDCGSEKGNVSSSLPRRRKEQSYLVIKIV